MPYVRIWVHAVWTTKNKDPWLEKSIREIVFEHIAENAKKKKIWIDCINGYDDHVHCLIQLRPTQSISGVMKLIKGESSHWINQENLCDGHFEWQVDYYANSVSESAVETVRNYIARQDIHHLKITLQDEYNVFLEPPTDSCPLLLLLPRT